MVPDLLRALEQTKEYFQANRIVIEGFLSHSKEYVFGAGAIANWNFIDWIVF